MIVVNLVDIIDRSAAEPIVIKSTTMFRTDFARHLEGVGDTLRIPEQDRGIAMHSEGSPAIDDAKFYPTHDWLMRRALHGRLASKEMRARCEITE